MQALDPRGLEELQDNTPSLDNNKTLPSVSNTNFKRKLLTVVVSLFLFIFLGFSAHQWFYLKETPTAPDITNKVPAQHQPKIDDVVLFPYVSNFDTLKISDVPSLSDVRTITPYKGNLIIVGYNQILEYDPQTQQIIRQANNRRFGSIASGAVVSDFLYVSGDKLDVHQPKDFPPSYDLWKIDLPSGKIVKQYFLNDTRRLTNLSVANKDSILWMSSWDGVIRLNTSDDSMRVFDFRQAKVTDNHCFSDMVIENNQPMALINCGSLGVTTYDEATDSWEYKPVESDYYRSFLAKDPKTSGIELPTYLMISNKVGDHYYIFGSNTIATLKEAEFPVQKVPTSFSVDEHLLELIESSTAYVTSNEKYALLVSLSLKQGNPNQNLYYAKLIDLNTGFVTDLVKEYQSVSDEENKGLIISDLNGAYFENDTSLIQLKSSRGEILLEVNPETKQMSFPTLSQ